MVHLIPTVRTERKSVNECGEACNLINEQCDSSSDCWHIPYMWVEKALESLFTFEPGGQGQEAKGHSLSALNVGLDLKRLYTRQSYEMYVETSSLQYIV